jgi:hypothetical protein
MTDVDAAMAITLAIAAVRKPSAMAAPQQPQQFYNKVEKQFTVSKLKNA